MQPAPCGETVTDRSDTNFEVCSPLGAGSVEYWGPDCVTVYVDQPGRSAVVDNDRFAALVWDGAGRTARYDDRVTDAAYARAVAVLEAFRADPGTPVRLAVAHRVRVREVAERLARLKEMVADRAADLERLQGEIGRRMALVEAAAADDGRPLPRTDDLYLPSR